MRNLPKRIARLMPALIGSPSLLHARRKSPDPKDDLSILIVRQARATYDHGKSSQPLETMTDRTLRECSMNALHCGSLGGYTKAKGRPIPIRPDYPIRRDGYTFVARDGTPEPGNIPNQRPTALFVRGQPRSLSGKLGVLDSVPNWFAVCNKRTHHRIWRRIGSWLRTILSLRHFPFRGDVAPEGYRDPTPRSSSAGIFASWPR